MVARICWERDRETTATTFHSVDAVWNGGFWASSHSRPRPAPPRRGQRRPPLSARSPPPAAFLCMGIEKYSDASVRALHALGYPGNLLGIRAERAFCGPMHRACCSRSSSPQSSLSLTALHTRLGARPSTHDSAATVNQKTSTSTRGHLAIALSPDLRPPSWPRGRRALPSPP